MNHKNRVNFLIKLKVKYTTEFFDIHLLKRENIKKIERCDRLIKDISFSQKSI